MLSSVLNAHPSPDSLCHHNSLFFHSGQYIIFLASKSSFFFFFFNLFCPPRGPDPHAHRSLGIVPRQQQCDRVDLRSKLLSRQLHEMLLLCKTVPESTSAMWQSTFKTFAQIYPSRKYGLQSNTQSYQKRLGVYPTVVKLGRYLFPASPPTSSLFLGKKNGGPRKCN